MHCLKIEDKWVNLIMNGKKTWEIRRTNTKIRERIALGNTKTKCCVGYATIVDSIEMSLVELKKHNNKHQANGFLDEYAKGKKFLFTWILNDIKLEVKPKPYSYSTGSWCNLQQVVKGKLSLG
jgi:hypothetical protein